MKKKYLPFLIIGLTILTFFLIMAIFPSIFTSYGRKQSFEPWQVSSKEHILGTNYLGYDNFTELVYGARETILVGIVSSALATIIGIIIGILAAKKGIIGLIFNGLINIFILLPKLITLIVLATFLGNSIINLIILISIFSSINIAKNIRTKAIQIQNSPYIEICKMYGYSKFHIAAYHYLPNLKDIILTNFLLCITSCIMMESTLSFLGLGNIYYPTWGVIINLAKTRGALIRHAYSYILAPCICIMLLSLSFYFIYLYINNKNNIIQE